MKTLNTMMVALALTAVPMVHAEQRKAGPNGGRVIEAIEPHVEFFVMPDRKVKLTFLDDDGKVVAVKEQSATAIGGDRTKPTKFKFTKVGDALVSDVAIPEGNMFPLILQFKVTPDAKTVTEKFSVDFSDCPSCVHVEYACTCAH